MKASGRLGLYAYATTMQIFDINSEDLISEVDSPAGATTFLDGAADADMLTIYFFYRCVFRTSLPGLTCKINLC